MDPRHFDALTRVLSAPDSRRRVLGLLTAVPVVGGLLGILSSEETEAAGRRKRRKKAHKHGKGRRRKKQKHKKKPQCTPTTCAAQGKTCGSIPDGCGKTIRRTEIWKIQSLLRTTHFKGDPAYAMLATAGLSSTTMALVEKRILCCHIDGLGPADHFDGDTRKFHGMCLL